MERSFEEEAPTSVARAALARAPVVWMLGKVQSGKTSIIRAITGCSDAEIGSGFKACTRHASIFDFPEEAPLIRFLDTRGLGEAGYEADDDIAVSEAQAHLLLVVMRAMDAQQEGVIEILTEVCRRHPDWPVVVAQTSLHEAFPPGANLPQPYPFGAEGLMTGDTRTPVDLLRSLNYQRALFEKIPQSSSLRFVPLDFTHPEDGIEPPNYGLDELFEAIKEAAPRAISANLAAIRAAGYDRLSRRSQATILGHASAAAAADVLPLAGAVAVPTIQANMLRSIGIAYATKWDRRLLAEFAGGLGAGILTRLLAVMGVRQIAKLIPVYGQTAGAAAAAASSFATTYALGQAASYYLARRRSGDAALDGIADTYRQALGEAISLARQKRQPTAQPTETPNAP